MWAPAGGVYLSTTLALLAVWLAASEREAPNVKRQTSSVNLGAVHDV
jgi:hypothetical protein